MKKDPEWLRGNKYGREACAENLTKYSRAFAEESYRHLKINARKRDAQAFDKGYAAGFFAKLKSGEAS